MTVKADIGAKVEKMTTDYQNQKVKKGSWRKDMARYKEFKSYRLR